MTGEVSMAASEVLDAAKDAIASWVDEPDDEPGDTGTEPEQGEQPSEEESTSREDEGTDPETAEKELSEHGPEWVKKRLAVVTAKRREAEEALAAAKAEAEQAKAQAAEAARKAKASKSIFDEDDEDDEPEDDEKTQLKKRLEAIERKEQEREFERVVQQAKAKHPTLPDVVLFSALAQGIDIDDAATAFETQLESIIADRLAKQKGGGATAKKPPVSVGGKSSGGAGKEPAKPKEPRDKRGRIDVRALARGVFDSIMDEDQ